MEVDNSNNEDETEFYKTPSFSAVTESTGYNNYYNSHKKLNWKVTPEFTLKAINEVTNNQLMFAKNIESHIKAIQDISKAVNDLKEEIKNLNGKM